MRLEGENFGKKYLFQNGVNNVHSERLEGENIGKGYLFQNGINNVHSVRLEGENASTAFTSFAHHPSVDRAIVNLGSPTHNDPR